MNRMRIGALLLGVVGCGSGNPVVAPGLPSGCTEVRSPSNLGNQHVAPPKKVTYNSTPPSSGMHYPTPAKVDVYPTPIPNEVQVHNLEHGHVMVQYRDLTADEVKALEAVVSADHRMVLLAPYPDMTPRVALTSWGKIQTCDVWDPAVLGVVRFFIRTHRDKAPESIG